MSNDSFRLRGGNGGHFLNSAEGAVTGDFREFEAVTAAVIAGITAPDITNAADLVGVSLPAGTSIRGKITSIELTSGEAMVYK